MNPLFMRIMAAALAILLLMPAAPRGSAHAASDSSGASNLTYGFAALVIVTVGIVAWQMDFGRDDDMITHASRDGFAIGTVPSTVSEGEAVDLSGASLCYRARF